MLPCARASCAPCCSFGAVTQGRCTCAAGWRVQKHRHVRARAMQEVGSASPRLGACTHSHTCAAGTYVHTHRCGLFRCIPVSCMATQGLTCTPTHVHAHSHTGKCCSGENPNFDALEASDRAWCCWGLGARRQQSHALQSAKGKQESERGRAGNRLLLGARSEGSVSHGGGMPRPPQPAGPHRLHWGRTLPPGPSVGRSTRNPAPCGASSSPRPIAPGWKTNPFSLCSFPGARRLVQISSPESRRILSLGCISK